MKRLIVTGLVAFAILSAGCHNGNPFTVDGKWSNAKIEHLRADRPDDPYWAACLEAADVDENKMINRYHSRREGSVERGILERCYEPWRTEDER